MPRTTLPRLPQIIRVNAPVRPQPPAHAVPAAAKPPLPSASPTASAGATTTASMGGFVTPVQSTRPGMLTSSLFLCARCTCTEALKKGY